MAVLKCKMCGGELSIDSNQNIAICQYCGSKQTIPSTNNEKDLDLYNLINQLRRDSEYDKALALCEDSLRQNNTSPEFFWNRVLCNYGVLYVEDPTTHRHIPTINRMQYKTILKDADYLNALKYADEKQKSVFEEQALEIENIQKQFFDISKKEKPYDVFICYKETDENGQRTQDSVVANDLYHQLTKEGFKVFFARITLENKLGSEYEPYIFAALNSAKVMVVIGSKPEYFNAVWVKNEWSRFLELAQNDPCKTIIPAYKNMDPYNLPKEFAHLQAQDMSKLGFMPDLTRGIRKIIDEANRKSSTNSFLKKNWKWIIPSAVILIAIIICSFIWLVPEKSDVSNDLYSSNNTSSSDNAQQSSQDNKLKELGLAGYTSGDFVEQKELFLPISTDYDFMYSALGNIVIDNAKTIDKEIVSIVADAKIHTNKEGKTTVYLISGEMYDTVEITVCSIDIPETPVLYECFGEFGAATIQITDIKIEESKLKFTIKSPVIAMLPENMGFWLVTPKGGTDYVKFFSIYTQFTDADFKDGEYIKQLSFDQDLSKLFTMPGRYSLNFGETARYDMVVYGG